MTQALQTVSAAPPPARAAHRFVPPSHTREIWLCFLRHRFLAAGIVALIMGTIVAALFIVTPRHRATALIMIEARNSEVIKTDAVLSRLPSDFDSVSGELQVLQSRDMIEQLVRRLRLDGDAEFDPNRSLTREIAGRWDFAGAILARIGGVVDPPLLTGQARFDAIVEAVRRRLEVAPIGRSRVISVTFTSRNPETASSVVNTLAGMYISRQTEIKEEATQEANQWIKERLSGLREQAQASAAAVERFRAESGLIQGRDTPLVRQQLSDLSTVLTAATAARVEAAAKLDAVRRAAASRGNASSDVLGSRLIQELRARQAQLAGDYFNLEATAGSKNPALVAMNASMADIEKRIETEIKKIVTSVEGDYQAAAAREATLRQQLEEAKTHIVGLTGSQARLNYLEHEAQADGALFDTFLQRYKETGIEHSYQAPDAQIISHAAVPLRPYFPDARVLLPIGAILSVLAAAVVLLIVDLRDRGFRSREQMERVLGTTAIGLVPELRRRERDEVGVPDPLSLLGSAMTDLYIRSLGRSLPKSVLVASALPMEGKTTLSLCLGRTAAANGKRVLLIDADLRRSGLTDRFNDQIGLSDVLRGGLKPESALQGDPAVGTLSVMGSGSPVRNPAGLLASEAMREFVEACKADYDLIVIDSPALMAGPDGWSLSQIADETLYVVRWARTPRHVAEAGLRSLREAGARISGAVLTMVNLKRIADYSPTDAINYSTEIRRYYRRRAA